MITISLSKVQAYFVLEALDTLVDECDSDTCSACKNGREISTLIKNTLKGG